jgi:hypothetical protein
LLRAGFDNCVFTWASFRVLTLSPLSVKSMQPYYDLTRDPYAKRTAGRVAATPAPKSDRVGPAAYTPRAGACRPLELLGCAPRRHRWSTIPARLWRNGSAAHLNLSPRQWRWLPSPHLHRASATDSRRPADPASRMGTAKWRVPHV